MIHNPELVFEICFERYDDTCRWYIVRSNESVVMFLLAFRQCEQCLMVIVVESAWHGSTAVRWLAMYFSSWLQRLSLQFLLYMVFIGPKENKLSDKIQIIWGIFMPSFLPSTVHKHFTVYNCIYYLKKKNVFASYGSIYQSSVKEELREEANWIAKIYCQHLGVFKPLHASHPNYNIVSFCLEGIERVCNAWWPMNYTPCLGKGRLFWAV